MNAAGHAIEGGELPPLPRRSPLAILTEDCARVALTLHLRCVARVLRASYPDAASRDIALMDAARDVSGARPQIGDPRASLATAILACRLGDVERAAATLSRALLGEDVAWQDYVTDCASEQGVEVSL